MAYSHQQTDATVNNNNGKRLIAIDSLQLQMATFEDKVLNLTKLLKLSQTLAEEKENDLRKENHEVKVRLRRQEQMNAKLMADMKELQSRIPEWLREGMQTTSGELQGELSEIGKAVRDTTRAVDLKLADAKEELLKRTDDRLIAKLAELKSESIDQLRMTSRDHHTAIEAMQARFDVLEKQTLEQFRSQLEDRVGFVTNVMKDAIMTEVRNCVRAVDADVHEELERLRAGLDKVENRCATIEATLSEFMKSYKDNVLAQSARMEETAAGVKELVALQDQTRVVVGGELERTKEWATRNMHRLKKHIDTLNADIQALKEAQIDTTAAVDRLKHQHTDEKERLAALLATRTQEAARLTEMVDKEIVGIRQITTGRRTTTSSTATGPTTSPPPPAGAASSHGMRSSRGARERDRDYELGDLAFPRPTEPERSAPSMFDELAFSRQRNSASKA